MSGVGPSELIVLVVIGLLILGPERLPRVASQIGRWVGKARRTANQLRYQLEREVALADIEKNKTRKDGSNRPHDDIAGSRDSDQAGKSDTTGGSDTAAADETGRGDSPAEAAAGTEPESKREDVSGPAPGDDKKTG